MDYAKWTFWLMIGNVLLAFLAMGIAYAKGVGVNRAVK